MMRGSLFYLGMHCLLTGLLWATAHSQTVVPAPTPAIVDEVSCVRPSDYLVIIKVSVWNPKTKQFLNDLHYKDLEIRNGSEVYEIVFFSKAGNPRLEKVGENEYVIAFEPSDLRKVNLHDIQVRLRSGQGLGKAIVEVSAYSESIL